MRRTPLARAGAVIVAAGSGSRMNVTDGTGRMNVGDPAGGSRMNGVGSDGVGADGADRMNGAGSDGVRKQYLELCGMPVLEWALRAFFISDVICEVVLVTAEEDAGYCEREFRRLAGGKRFVIVTGGPARQMSVDAGARAVSASCEFIAVHDGARPFIDTGTIRASVEAADRTGAACVAVRVTDTIKSAVGAYIDYTPDRSALWAAQTPQTFRRGLLLEALEAAGRDGFVATDDVALVERLGRRVEIVEGSYDNIKITTLKDMAAAREIAARLRQK